MTTRPSGPRSLLPVLLAISLTVPVSAGNLCSSRRGRITRVQVARAKPAKAEPWSKRTKLAAGTAGALALLVAWEAGQPGSAPAVAAGPDPVRSAVPAAPTHILERTEMATTAQEMLEQLEEPLALWAFPDLSGRAGDLDALAEPVRKAQSHYAAAVYPLDAFPESAKPVAVGRRSARFQELKALERRAAELALEEDDGDAPATPENRLELAWKQAVTAATGLDSCVDSLLRRFLAAGRAEDQLRILETGLQDALRWYQEASRLQIQADLARSALAGRFNEPGVLAEGLAALRRQQLTGEASGRFADVIMPILDLLLDPPKRRAFPDEDERRPLPVSSQPEIRRVGKR
jgi:hypothetical protein